MQNKPFKLWWKQSTKQEKDKLSNDAALHRNFLSGVASGKERTTRTTKIAIAASIGESVHILFPEEQPLQRELPPRFHGVDQGAIRA